MIELDLNLFGKGRAHTLQVHFLGIKSARLNKELMTLFLGKADNLVLKARAVTRTYALNLAAVER